LQQSDDVTELVPDVKKGDVSAFEILYDRTSPSVYRTVCYLMGTRKDAEDIVQDIYLEVFRSIGQFDKNRAFRPWLYGIVFNHVRASRRKSWRFYRMQHRLWGEASTSEERDLENETINKLTWHHLIDYMNRLPFKYKQVMVLHYMHDFTLVEVSEIVQIPTGTVKSRLHVGLAKLRQNRKLSGTITEGRVGMPQ